MPTTKQKFPDSVLGGRLTLAEKIHEAISDKFTADDNDDLAVLSIAVILAALVIRDEMRAARAPKPSGGAAGTPL